jgi:hypothetical protein
MEKFSQRLQAVLDHFEMTPYKLSKEINYSTGGFSSLFANKTSPSFDFLNKLLQRFPSIDANWLILGKGEMFLDPSIKPNRSYSHSPDLLEAKNSIINKMEEILKLKDEKIEKLNNELREYRAAAKILKTTGKSLAEKKEKSR